MTFNSPLWFVLFLILFIVGGNLLAWHLQFHVEYPVIGYCQDYGC